MGRAIEFILHTFRLIVGNLVPAVHITISWFVLLVALILVPPALFGQMPPGILAIVYFILIFTVAVLASGSTAIAWHRYILLNELPRGIIPLPDVSLAFRYVWRALGIGLLILAIIIIPAFVIAMLVSPMLMGLAGSTNSLGGAIVFSIPGMLIAMMGQFMLYRFSLSLPGLAINMTEYKIRESWEDSKAENGTIIWIVVLVTVVSTAVTILLTWPFVDITNPAGPHLVPLPISFITMIFQWFYFMFSIGILTTLYGVIVEGRRI
jgi:hypothetical protein